MEKSNRNYNGDNVNLTKISSCFGFDNVAQNVDIRRSKYSILKQTTEAAVRDPTATPRRPLWGRDPPVGNHCVRSSNPVNVFEMFTWNIQTVCKNFSRNENTFSIFRQAFQPDDSRSTRKFGPKAARVHARSRSYVLSWNILVQNQCREWLLWRESFTLDGIVFAVKLESTIFR